MTRAKYSYELVDGLVDSINTDHHAVCEHGWTPDSHLIARMRTEKRSGASCFQKGTDIVEKIIDAIYDAEALVPWVNSKIKDDLTIVEPCKGCGKKFTKTCDWVEGSSIPCDRFRIIIGKEFDKAGCLCGLFLKSAYPI